MIRISFDFPSWKADLQSGPRGDEPNCGLLNDREALLHDLDDLDSETEAPTTDNMSVEEDVPRIAEDVQEYGGDSTGSEHVELSGAAVWLRGGGVWPDDVLYAVLTQLAGLTRELVVSRAVSHSWREAASADAHWAAAWRAHPRYPKRPPRLPCGATLAPRQPRYARFAEWCTRTRADYLYSWSYLQKGWDKLEALLAPDATQRDPTQARKLSSILAARDWQLLHRCVLVILAECSEQHACVVLEEPAASNAASEAIAVASASASPSASAYALSFATASTSSQATLEPDRDPSFAGHAGTRSGSLIRRPRWNPIGIPHASAHDTSADERLLVRLLHSWRAYSRWLAHVCGAFAHHAASTCRTHLVCLLAAERCRERVDQHTPSVLHAGYAAFRQAVVCHPRIESALRRHVQRATASVLAQGGFDIESGQLMQQLLDLQHVLSTLDVRDDHLCEERGERPMQETLREALLTPIKQLWQAHSRSWFCGTKISEEDLNLYSSSPRRRQRIA
jgi:hypothetical protein